MKKKYNFLFTPWFMGVLFVVYAISMAFATFYENDFGAEAAKAVVYNTRWFELIMFLMVVNLAGQVFIYKLYKRGKLTILIFHLAFVIILIGAGITRYFGFEGIVHIREGNSTNYCTSVDKYLSVKATSNSGEELYSASKKMVINSTNKLKFKKNFTIDGIDYSVKLKDFLPNAGQTIIDIPTGEPMVSIMVNFGRMGQESIILEQGDIINLNGLLFGFVEDNSADINIKLNEQSYNIQSKLRMREMSMMAQQGIEYDENMLVPFERMKVYQFEGFSVVLEQASLSGIAKAVNIDSQQQRTNKSALEFEIAYNNKMEYKYLWLGRGMKNNLEIANGSHKLELNYSSTNIEFPFYLKLEDFILDRYPGSSSPSSYKSEVVLIDTQNDINMPYSIYMNHILKYKGWRFYQSSYDKDEKGTILSVNKDFAGMFVTYIGYFALFIFILLSLVNKKSVFWTVSKGFFKSTAGKASVILALFLSISFYTSAQHSQKLVVDKQKADDFGKILVQDQKGRTEPLYTLSNDILRKVSRETEIEGYTPMQVFMGLYFDFANWRNVPLIKVSNSEVKRMIGVSGDYAAFTDIIDMNTNAYKLSRSVNLAYEKPAGARNKFDKEVIKVDERVNICYMVYLGEFLKIFPVNGPNQKWYPPKEAYTFARNSEDSLYLMNILNFYAESIWSGNYSRADETLTSIINYQRKFAQYELPSKSKINAEVFYYKSKIFNRLFPLYTSIGLILLIALIYGIIARKKDISKIIYVFTGLLIIGFLFHTLGLAIRWYVSGHSPMSNGYESMIFISWIAILAGLILRRFSAFVLAAASILGGFTLLVAHLSFMDPEITNLVPVLQSYWLTLHVSVIISSYAFLGIGAVIALIVLILYSLSNKNNILDIELTIKKLTDINYISLTLGLYLLTIGTFLGAIWANESWGRYWGWDPKETWSLITIIVYSFVIHSRMIKGLKGFYAFNILALFGFSSVLMTYFGVNYYLSGLHSYAGGDPVPVPNFVYVSIVLLVTLSLFGYYKKRTVAKNN